MEKHKSYLFLFNVSKKSNFGFMIRTANAFGAEMIVIGKKKYNTIGAVGGTRLTPTHHFYSLKDGVAFARQQGCQIMGVEIMDGARSICETPFVGSTAFMMGNEGMGLEPWQMELCDEFVYIPQHGTAKCLNVNVAAAVCLHRFADWAGFQQCSIQGLQFQPCETLPEMHRRVRQGAGQSVGQSVGQAASLEQVETVPSPATPAKSVDGTSPS